MFLAFVLLREEGCSTRLASARSTVLSGRSSEPRTLHNIPFPILHSRWCETGKIETSERMALQNVFDTRRFKRLD